MKEIFDKIVSLALANWKTNSAGGGLLVTAVIHHNGIIGEMTFKITSAVIMAVGMFVSKDTQPIPGSQPEMPMTAGNYQLTPKGRELIENIVNNQNKQQMFETLIKDVKGVFALSSEQKWDMILSMTEKELTKTGHPDAATAVGQAAMIVKNSSGDDRIEKLVNFLQTEAPAILGGKAVTMSTSQAGQDAITDAFNAARQTTLGAAGPVYTHLTAQDYITSLNGGK